MFFLFRNNPLSSRTMKFSYQGQIVTIILSASLFLLVFLPLCSSASSLTLAWDPNMEDDLAGYNIYYGIRSGDYDRVIDAGDVTQRTVRNLKPEIRYYFSLTAYDFSGNESDFSGEVSAVTDASSSPPPVSGGGGGGGCFIATAAYGSYLDAHVKILRDFRDRFLIPNSLGRKCVHLYYRYTPRMANYIGRYKYLRFFTRQALLPFVGMSCLSVTATVPNVFILLLLCFLTVSVILLRPYFRRTR
jgi:hypothetical protein